MGFHRVLNNAEAKMQTNFVVSDNIEYVDDDLQVNCYITELSMTGSCSYLSVQGRTCEAADNESSTQEAGRRTGSCQRGDIVVH